MIVANETGYTLFVTGQSAQMSELARISITSISSNFTVRNNDAARTEVQIGGTEAEIENIDARGVTGAGVSIFSNFDNASVLRGSNQNDRIFQNGSGNDRIFGYSGDDLLLGEDGNDRLFGGSGNDLLSGGAGRDLISGGAGDDQIDGGLGLDTLLLSGNMSEYDVTSVGGRYQISHLSGSGMDGVDTFANIDVLKFADQDLQISSAPLNMTGTVSGVTLFVSGVAATTSADTAVMIAMIGTQAFIEDNDAIATTIPVVGLQADIENIDVRGVSGSGVYMFSSYDGASDLMGSDQDDNIYSFGNGNDDLQGFAGDDTLIGNGGNDRLIGHRGDDNLSGGEGRDVLVGGAGNDLIDGGNGIDTLLLRGDRSEYVMEAVGNSYQLSHVGGNGSDGFDTFSNIEFLKFADETVEISSAPTNMMASVLGSTLVLFGAAGGTDSSNTVDVVAVGTDATVSDNDAIGTNIPIVGIQANIKHIDALDVTGAGVYIYSAYAGDSILDGSQQADDIVAAEQGNDRIVGYNGDDTLSGGEGNDRIIGGNGDDHLIGGAGRDALIGGRGADHMEGGDGIDTLVFRGDMSEYEMEADGSFYEISHIGGSGLDGTDTFSDIEVLVFSDQRVDIDDWVF